MSDNNLRGIPDELIPAMERKIMAEALKEEKAAEKEGYLADKYKMDLFKATVEHDRMLAGDFFHKKFYFDSSVNEKTVGMCMDQLDQWHRMADGPETIELIITSPGGTVVDGMALFDHIKFLQREGHTINTTALGVAASMGGILLQAGDTRSMTKEAWLLIHEISGGVMGSFGEMEDRIDWVARTQARILNIFAERSAASGVKKPLSYRELERGWKRKDWWLDSDQALERGLIDEVR